ncbi:DMT family transporter [Acinetobacter terrestris]|uniref:DMT family transporter n=1 Tax=Acinetobacter terrestris TaxID=2529843 RepID=A0ABX1USZ6_9GAMM|nr:DMT family transporter [Acinetobacter terrestris]NNH25746.1 DMT family transporter [Acinetobacter terrestris]TCB40282.1 DMT family transporter [Acinetobacter terrestris]TCB64223.1 DMT family transporter [Acinetobacter terrestris]
MIYIMLLVVILGGAVLCAQSSINGRLGSEVGVLESSWLTFVMGTLISFLIAFFFEPQYSLNLFTAPRWQLTGAFFGVTYMLIVVFAMPRLGAAATTVAVISGQLVMSLLIDNFGWFNNAVITMDGSRVAALVLLAIALFFIYKSNVTAKSPPTIHSVDLDNNC